MSTYLKTDNSAITPIRVFEKYFSFDKIIIPCIILESKIVDKLTVKRESLY